MECVKKRFLSSFCANIVDSGLVGCWVVIVVAFVDADVINSMRKDRNVFCTSQKKRFVGSFVRLFIAASTKNATQKANNVSNRNGVAIATNRCEHCLTKTMQKRNTFYIL